MTIRCTDCKPGKRGRPRRVTHVPPSFWKPNGTPVRDGGWDGAAWCSEHAADHPDATKFAPELARQTWDKS